MCALNYNRRFNQHFMNFHNSFVKSIPEVFIWNKTISLFMDVIKVKQSSLFHSWIFRWFNFCACVFYHWRLNIFACFYDTFFSIVKLGTGSGSVRIWTSRIPEKQPAVLSIREYCASCRSVNCRRTPVSCPKLYGRKKTNESEKKYSQTRTELALCSTQDSRL